MNHLFISVFVRNFVRRDGGALQRSGPVTNCTFIGNEANRGPNMNITGPVKNSIFWDMKAPLSSQYTYSIVQLGVEGSTNVDSDPVFMDLANGDYRLSAASPAIDAGDPSSPKDPDGTRADMGAYYFDQSDVDIVTVSPDSLDFGCTIGCLQSIICSWAKTQGAYPVG